MSNPLDHLVHELSKLPAIGEKTAMRLALHILRQSPEYGKNLARALAETVGRVGFCERCFHLATEKLCPICQNTQRNQSVLCVVEEVADLLAIEKTRRHQGVYHVLHGSLSPIDGIGPDDLKIRELLVRLENEPIQEIIFALNPNVNGDVTSVYLSKLIKPFGVSLTKLASGIPVGGHIEFIDENTLSRAMEKRVAF